MAKGHVRASQRRTRPAAQKAAEIEAPWHAGDRVHWRDRAGVYQRDTGDGQNVEIVIAERVSGCGGPSCCPGETGPRRAR